MKRLLISSAIVLSLVILISAGMGCSQATDAQSLTGQQQYQSDDMDVFTQDDNTF